MWTTDIKWLVSDAYSYLTLVLDRLEHQILTVGHKVQPHGSNCRV